VRDELRAAGVTAVPGTVDDGCLIVQDGGDPRALPGFAEGRRTVQDQASAFVVADMAPRDGDRLCDACAAPGGKALTAGEIVGSAGSVLAADVSPRRLGLVAQSAAPLGRAPWPLAHGPP